MKLTREQSFSLLKKHMSKRNLINHSLAAEAAMRGLAHHFSQNEERWGIVGLLHDGDYEVVKHDLSRHAKQMVEWLREEGETDEELLRAILSHVYSHTGEHEPQSKMEWAIFCADELTGLIVGCALVQPEKKLSSVTVDGVIKKFGTKGFCANVNRESIAMCKDKLGIPLVDFVKIVLASMTRIAPTIGL